MGDEVDPPEAEEFLLNLIKKIHFLELNAAFVMLFVSININ